MTAMRVQSAEEQTFEAVVVERRLVSVEREAAPSPAPGCTRRAGSCSPTCASASSPTASPSSSAATWSCSPGTTSSSAPTGRCWSRWRSPSSSSTPWACTTASCCRCAPCTCSRSPRRCCGRRPSAPWSCTCCTCPSPSSPAIIVVGTFTLFFVFAAIVRTVVLPRVLGAAVPGGHGRHPRRRLAAPHRAAARAPDHAQGLQPRDARRRRQGAARGRARLRSPARAHGRRPAGVRHALRRRRQPHAHADARPHRRRPALRRRRSTWSPTACARSPAGACSSTCSRRRWCARAARPASSRRAPVKRAFDIIVSAGALLVLSPLMLAIALAVKLTSRGPVLYAQERIGLDGRPFKFYKFRSMQQRRRHRGALRVHAGAHQRRGRDQDAVGRGRGGRGLQAGRRSARHRASAACCGATRSTSCRSSGTCSSAT